MNTVIGPQTSESLLSKDTLDTVLTSVNSFQKSCRHRYVQNKTKKCLKPVLFLAAFVYLLGLILIIPINLVAFVVHLLSLGSLDTKSVTAVCARWLKEATALVPLVSVLFIRSAIRKPLYKCFIHLLREVNPAMAKSIENLPRIRNPNRQTWRHWASAYVSKTMQLLILEFFIFLWRQLPYLGLAAEPVMHFVTMAHALEPRRAIVLSAMSFVPYIRPWVQSFVHLWRASSVLGMELLEDYVSHIIVHAERDSFFQRRAVTITTFVMPQLLVMQLPILGPMAMLPMAGSTAYLVDLLVGKGEPTTLPSSEGGSSTVPTVPVGPTPPQNLGGPGKVASQAPSQAGLHARPAVNAGGFPEASAPPWQG